MTRMLTNTSVVNTTANTSVLTADPTRGFVQYTKAVKPYHTKILDVLVEYSHQENIGVTIQDKWYCNFDLTRTNYDILPTCGYGIMWDSYPFVINDFPPITVKQAVGNTPIVVRFFEDNNPSHILISYNPDNYIISIGDPVTFQTTGTLPHSTIGDLSPGLVYYVTAVSGNTFTISKTIAGIDLIFTNAGSGELLVHQENLKYNSFLVENNSSTQYQCIATNIQANQFTFINAYPIIAVNASMKQWTVGGQLVSQAYQDVLFYVPIVGTDPTGLTNDSTIYSASAIIDGVSFVLSIMGSGAQTYDDLILELNTILTTPTATIVNDKIRITSSTNGYLSTVNIIDTDLFSSLNDFNVIAPMINTTVVIPDNNLYIHNNTGDGADGKYTIVSATIVSGNTVITVAEQISLLAQPNGTLNIQDDLSLIPNWAIGLKVKTSSPDILPAPLNNTDYYYFVPTEEIGVFNLSTKQLPTSNADIIDVTSFGTGIINIEKAELLYPGAVVTVSNSYLSRNDGIYYVRSSVPEGIYYRINTLQRVHRTTPSTLTFDGIMIVDPHNGYAVPNYCANLSAPELYTDTFVDEHIAFEFVIRLNDELASQFSENDVGVHDTPEFFPYTSVPQFGQVLLPMGLDTQYFDIGVLDEDQHYDNHNLGTTL